MSSATGLNFPDSGDYTALEMYRRVLIIYRQLFVHRISRTRNDFVFMLTTPFITSNKDKGCSLSAGIMPNQTCRKMQMNNLVVLSPLLSLTFHGVGSTPYLQPRKPSCAGCLTGRSLHWLRTRVRREFQNPIAHSHLHIREGRATYTAPRVPAVFTVYAASKITIFLARKSSGSRSVANGKHNTQTLKSDLSSV